MTLGVCSASGFVFNFMDCTTEPRGQRMDGRRCAPRREDGGTSHRAEALEGRSLPGSRTQRARSRCCGEEPATEPNKGSAPPGSAVILYLSLPPLRLVTPGLE